MGHEQRKHRTCWKNVYMCIYHFTILRANTAACCNKQLIWLYAARNSCWCAIGSSGLCTHKVTRYLLFGIFLHLYTWYSIASWCIMHKQLRPHMKDSNQKINIINIHREMLKTGQVMGNLEDPSFKVETFLESQMWLETGPTHHNEWIGRFGVYQKNKMKDQHSISTSSSLCHTPKSKEFWIVPTIKMIGRVTFKNVQVFEWKMQKSGNIWIPAVYFPAVEKISSNVTPASGAAIPNPWGCWGNCMRCPKACAAVFGWYTTSPHYWAWMRSLKLKNPLVHWLFFIFTLKSLL